MFHNLTNQEYFRLHGTLPSDRIEELLHDPNAEIDLAGAVAKIEEGMGQFPEEDFGHDIIGRLQALAKCVRGANREELLSIIGAAEDLFQCQFYASDYGRSELIDAIKCIDPTGKHVSSRRVKKKFAPSGQ